MYSLNIQIHDFLIQISSSLLLKKERNRKVESLTSSKTFDPTCLSIMETYLGLCGIKVGERASSNVNFLAPKPLAFSHFLEDIVLLLTTMEDG